MSFESVTFLYTDTLHEIIDNISGPVAEALLKAQGDRFVKNPFKIEVVDVSKTHSRFWVTFKDHKQNMKIKAFINSILPNSFTDHQIWEFIQEYNKLALGKETQAETKVTYNKIEPRAFRFEPKDIRNTFAFNSAKNPLYFLKISSSKPTFLTVGSSSQFADRQAFANLSRYEIF